MQAQRGCTHPPLRPRAPLQAKYIQAAASERGNEAIVRKLVALEKYEDALNGDTDDILAGDSGEEPEDGEPKRRVNFRARGAPYPTLSIHSGKEAEDGELEAPRQLPGARRRLRRPLLPDIVTAG